MCGLTMQLVGGFESLVNPKANRTLDQSLDRTGVTIFWTNHKHGHKRIIE